MVVEEFLIANVFYHPYQKFGIYNSPQLRSCNEMTIKIQGVTLNVNVKMTNWNTMVLGCN